FIKHLYILEFMDILEGALALVDISTFGVITPSLFSPLKKPNLGQLTIFISCATVFTRPPRQTTYSSNEYGHSDIVFRNQSNATASSKDQTTANWLFQPYEITVRPVTLLSLLIIILAGYNYTGEYRQEIQLCEPSLTEGDNITWIELPRAKEPEDYILLSSGAFVFKRFYMDEFEEEFWVEPINWPDFDKEILADIMSFKLQESVFQDKNIPAVTLKRVRDNSARFAPKIKDIELAVQNGTYVDDRSIYVRWVDENLRFGLFAGRDFEIGELLGIYTGEYVGGRVELEYAWEYNYLVQATNKKGEAVRCVIDARNKGNYLRFANHKDVDYNGEATYVMYNNMWFVLYVVKNNIKAHEQIFVNYGEAYWADRTKY
ncbi:1724_t:CDS:2, partial [Paraglomus occultum]